MRAKPKRKLTGKRSQVFSRMVYHKYGNICWQCGKFIDMRIKQGPMRFSVDHVIPFDEDPTRETDIDNARPAHLTCNSSRGKKPADQLHGPLKTSREW